MPPITRPLVASRWPARAVNAHKSSCGRVLVVAGSRCMCGAGLLCAKAALRAGAGLVYWALPQEMQPSFAAALPEAITLPLSQTETGEISATAWPVLEEFISRVRPSVAVIGPGLGSSPLLPRLVAEAQLPLVIDASALTDVIFKRPHENGPVICTPHPGEMARLLQTQVASDETARTEQVRQLAQQINGVSVLKGPGTLVCQNGQAEIWENTTGGPALAKGGSGDVLAGLIAGIWAQLGTANEFTAGSACRAALCGVYVHGLAGDLAAQALGDYSVLASDIISHIPAAIQTVVRSKK